MHWLPGFYLELSVRHQTSWSGGAQSQREGALKLTKILLIRAAYLWNTT